MTSYDTYRLVDLFCGCGGMTRGFVDAGSFVPVFANDFNEDALASYTANFDPERKHTVGGDIRRIVENPASFVQKADVVIGGPPCQGFSLLNKNRQGDPRRTLWFQFLKFAEMVDAKVIVMENVRQLLTSSEYLDMKEALTALGFKWISPRVLCAADYGVPEMRYRTIIMASRLGPIALPRPTHTSPDKLTQLAGGPMLFEWMNLQVWKDVRSAIGDLPEPVGLDVRAVPPPLDLHFGRTPTPVSLERYKAIPPGGNRYDLLRNRRDITPGCWIRKKTGGTDLMGRLWWDRPSVTIRTEFFKPEKGRYLHPDQHRPITHREAARIQSFPDDFRFVGSKIEIAKQIGNAVPPLLAKAIAAEVINALKGITSAAYVEETDAGFEYLASRNGGPR